MHLLDVLMRGAASSLFTPGSAWDERNQGQLHAYTLASALFSHIANIGEFIQYLFISF